MKPVSKYPSSGVRLRARQALQMATIVGFWVGAAAAEPPQAAPQGAPTEPKAAAAGRPAHPRPMERTAPGRGDDVDAKGPKGPKEGAGPEMAAPTAEASAPESGSDGKKPKMDPEKVKKLRGDYESAHAAMIAAHERFLSSGEMNPAAVAAHKKALERWEESRKALRSAAPAKHVVVPHGAWLEIAREFAKKGKERDGSRADRIKGHQEKLTKKYGEHIKTSHGRSELAAHAWRIARLQRIVELAKAGGRPDDAERAQKLLEREEHRHQARLERMAAKDGEADAKDEKGKAKEEASAQKEAPAATPAVPAAPAAAAAPATKEGQ